MKDATHRITQTRKILPKAAPMEDKLKPCENDGCYNYTEMAKSKCMQGYPFLRKENDRCRCYTSTRPDPLEAEKANHLLKLAGSYLAGSKLAERIKDFLHQPRSENK